MKKYATLLSTIALCSCGGGGSDTPTTSITAFPLLAGYKSLVAKGMTKNFSISGTCTGSGTRTTAPASTPSTFEGIPGFSAGATLTMSFTNCTPSSSANTVTAYSDSNYLPLGATSGTGYIVDSAFTYPNTVSVGDTGTIGTQTEYTDSTKTKLTYKTANISYVVTSDTSSTAVVTIIQKVFLPENGVIIFQGQIPTTLLSLTSQDRYRIDANGTLTPLSSDLQYANGSTTHLVLTYQ